MPNRLKDRLLNRLLKIVRENLRLRRNPFIRFAIKPVYYRFLVMTGVMKAAAGPDNDAILFYAQNADRIMAVTEMLADEQSKRVYSQAWQFQQTRNKRHFPPYDWRPQYMKMFPFNQGEVFIDCGACNGDTLDDFIRLCPHYGRIVAFEPGVEFYAQLVAKYGKLRDTTFLNAGVYDSDGEVSFINAGGFSAISTEPAPGLKTIRATTIDSLKLEKVTFIKMDVEGVEFNALKGAEKTILRDKPKLAISIYHSNEDMVRIPEQLRKLVPEYRFRIRHHECYPSAFETVLYADVPTF